MSTAWYFRTFERDKFAAFNAGMTPQQKRRLLKVLTDPDEFDYEDEELDEIKAAVAEVAEAGVVYAGKDEEASRRLDEIVTTLFHDDKLSATLGMKRVSPEGLNVRALPRWKDLDPKWHKAAAMPVLWNGRRLGEAKLSLCNYAIFSHDEARVLRDEVFALIEDGGVRWPHPSIPAGLREELTPAFEAVLADAKLDLYGACT